MLGVAISWALIYQTNKNKVWLVFLSLEKNRIQVKQKKETESCFLLVKVESILTMPTKNSKRRVSIDKAKIVRFIRSAKHCF